MLDVLHIYSTQSHAQRVRNDLMFVGEDSFLAVSDLVVPPEGLVIHKLQQQGQAKIQS